MQRADFKHFIELPVRWGDMDAFGHVNNVQYMRYLESGRVAYISEVLDITMEHKENIVLADIHCVFLQQLCYPATVEVATRVARLGNSSLQLNLCYLSPGRRAAGADWRGNSGLVRLCQ